MRYAEKQFMERFPTLNCQTYHHEVDLKKRDQIRAEFEQKTIRVLFATPNMIADNGFFKDFLLKQMLSEDVLLGL